MVRKVVPQWALTNLDNSFKLLKFDYLFDEAASREELVAQHSICNAFAHFFPSSSWLP